MIIFNQLSKGYRVKGDTKWVIRNFSGVFPDDVGVGILCARGQGKTTLINTLCGAELPSRGEVVRTQGVSWPFGYKGHLSAKLSARQNIRFLTTIYNRDFERTFNFVKDFAELAPYMDHELKKLTNEQKSRLGVALFFALKFRHNLFDETFELGDDAFRQKTIDHLRDTRDSVGNVFATSRPDVLRFFCRIGGVLKDTKLTLYDNVEDAIRHYERGLPV